MGGHAQSSLHLSNGEDSPLERETHELASRSGPVNRQPDALLQGGLNAEQVSRPLGVSRRDLERGLVYRAQPVVLGRRRDEAHHR